MPLEKPPKGEEPLGDIHKKPGWIEAASRLPGIRNLRDAVRRSEKLVLPKGTVFFHIDAGRGIPVDWDVVAETREKLNLSEMYIIHGIALEKEGGGYAITGPPGAGKSTMKNWMKTEGFRPIDDGWILLGKDRDNGGLKVVETGQHPMAERISRIQRSLRKCCLYKPSYNAEGAYSPRTGLDVLCTKLALMVGKLSMSFKKPDGEFQPKAYTLERWSLMEHESDHTPLEVLEREAKKTTVKDVMAAKTNSTDLTVISIPDPKAQEKAMDHLRKK